MIANALCILAIVLFASSLAVSFKGIFDGEYLKYSYYANTLIMSGWWISFIRAVLLHEYIWIWIDGTVAVVYTYYWWRNKRNKKWKKALKEAGAKTKAIIANMVKNMTPSPIPLPAKV